MKIIQLTAENVKKLTAIEISPDGNMVQITGKNGQGKTSVLDAIWWALAGTENIQKQPIRAGSEKARIVLKLGSDKDVELIVERRITEKSNTLEVKTAEGAKYPSPQKMLDDLLGALTFDPLAFMRQDAKGQFNVLRRLVALDVDPEDLDRLNTADFEARTGFNRDAKAKRAQAAAIAVEPDLPPQTLDESALLDKIQSAADENARIEQRRANRDAAKVKIAALTSDADRLESSIEADTAAIEQAAARETAIIEQQIADLTSKLAAVKDRAAREASELKSSRATAIASARAEAGELGEKLSGAGELPAPVDISLLRSELDGARATNAKIAARDRRLAIEADAELLETKAAALTEAMDGRKQKKLEAISRAKMPVDGLSFGDGVVTYNSVPLDQASDAEQLMVSTAIAAALNPKLRVLRIRDGSLLDDDAMLRLADFANERDFQIWIERVDGSGTVGFVMEDGHVKGQEPPPAETKAAKKDKAAA
jgi:hypothetical protein